MSRIRGSTALVTGASSGIGYHTAIGLASAGAKVAILARRRERLEALREHILKSHPGSEVLVIQGDVTEPEDVRRAFRTIVDRWGTLAILVNNAGVGLFGTTLQSDMADIRRMFEVNFFGLLHCIREALPVMLGSKRGHIVNVSSFVGDKGLPGFGPYSASKGAVNLLSESLACELSRTAIRITVVKPGMTETEFMDCGIYSNCPRIEKVHQGQSPQAVAKAILRAIRNDRRRLTLTLKAFLITSLNRISHSLADRVVCFVKRRDIDAYPWSRDPQ